LTRPDQTTAWARLARAWCAVLPLISAMSGCGVRLGYEPDEQGEPAETPPDPSSDTTAALVRSFGERVGAGTRNVTRDTDLPSTFPSENYGHSGTVSADALPLRSALLAFDLSSLDPSTRCSAAELHLVVQNPLETGVLVGYALHESWDEDEATWNERRAGVPWSEPGWRDAPSSRRCALNPRAGFFDVGVVVRG